MTAAATANQTIISTPTHQGSSTIFAAVEKEFDWNRTTTAGAASFGSAVGTVMGPFLGMLTDRIGPGRMVLVGMLLAGVGLIAFSRMNGPVQYYLFWLMVSAGISIGGFTPSIAAVNSWMSHKRATAMSIVLAGSSIGGLAVPLMAWGILAFGWRPTVVVAGIVILVSGPVIARILWRRPPGFGGRAKPGAAHTPVPGEQFDFTPREALRTRAFWAISIAHTLANLSVAVVQSQVVLHLDASGISLTKAAAVIPVMAATAFVFQLVGGYVGDKMDKRYPAAVSLVIHGGSVLLLAFTVTFPMAMVFAVLWGVGFGMRTPVLHAMRGDYFGRRHYATIMSLSAVPMALGMTLAPVIAGRVFDLQGTYKWVFVSLSAACVVAAWVILYAKRPAIPVRQ